MDSVSSKSWFALFFLAPTTLMFAPHLRGEREDLDADYRSVSGVISQLNYGREMEVTGFVVEGKTLVTFPPHIGAALGQVLQPGERVEVAGYGRRTASGMPRIELVTLAIAGKSFSMPRPWQFTSYDCSGRVNQFNYNGEGEVDGFLLEDGTFCKTPPHLSQMLMTILSIGTEILVAGFAHETITGKAVVDVQSINGRQIGHPLPPKPR
jgi:hypothetical protein